MRKRRKYEEAGGVVPLRWVRSPWPDSSHIENGNVVIAEVWDATIGYNGKHISVHARLCLVTKPDAVLLFGGEKLGKREVRRWAVLGSQFAAIPLTLETWEAP